MVFIFTIPVIIISLMVLWARNILIYRDNYEGSINQMKLNVMQMQFLFCQDPKTSKLFQLQRNFFNFSANLILKTILWVIVTVVVYFCKEDLQTVAYCICFAYLFFFVVAWCTYADRKNSYKNDIRPNAQFSFEPILKASICLPIYQTILHICLFITLII